MIFNSEMYDFENLSISEEEYFEKKIHAWIGSRERREMLKAKDYYLGKHDILKRKRTAIGKEGELEEILNLPNNLVVDNRFARIVDQKKNYLLGRPLTIRSENKDYCEELGEIFDSRFLAMLKLAGEEALIGGISWLYPYIDEKQKLNFRLFPSYEIFPLWTDSSHLCLNCAVRVYDVEDYRNGGFVKVTKVEIFKKDGISFYEYDSGKLIKIKSKMNYVTKGEKEYNWDILPIIPIKANAKETSILPKVKSLQDSLNSILSDFMNNMQENVRNSILVLRNYDGTDLGEFRKNLASYGVVKTRTENGSSGGVDVLKVEVDADNYKTICDILSSAITQNGRGFDTSADKSSGDLNQLNIKSMYSDIDLDANDMENELQAVFMSIVYFTNVYLKAVKNVNRDSEKLEVIFNRDILINETETIENCVKSDGILSKDTIIAQHPWVVDYMDEKERLKTN